jgi:DnaJ homolog subfamily C member 13
LNLLNLGVENSPAAKAELVDALKSACRDPQYGQKITDELNKSSIWSQYRDQRHDLFLPASRTQAITGLYSISRKSFEKRVFLYF